FEWHDSEVRHLGARQLLFRQRMRSVAAAIAGLVIRLSSPVRYGKSRETSIRKRAVFRSSSRGFGLRSNGVRTRCAPCHNQRGSEENQVQERPEINLFLTEITHSSFVENCQTQRAGRDG